MAARPGLASQPGPARGPVGSQARPQPLPTLQQRMRCGSDGGFSHKDVSYASRSALSNRALSSCLHGCWLSCIHKAPSIRRGGAPLAPALGTLPPFMTQSAPGQSGPGTAYPGSRPPTFAGMPPQKQNGLHMSGPPPPAADAAPQACCSVESPDHAVACRGRGDSAWHALCRRRTVVAWSSPVVLRVRRHGDAGNARSSNAYPPAGSADASAVQAAGGPAGAARAAG